tara:strand:- start:1178 stop:2467 length:1290 start_codon:yes stop_codon:yes gene_type:complete
MKSNSRLRGILLLLVIMSVAYWSYSQGTLDPLIQRFLKSGGRRSGPSISDYNFAPVLRREIRQTVLATGTVTLEVGAEIKIGSRISGQIEELFVKIGDFVKAGKVIAVIEHNNLLARVAQRTAELQAEEARLAKLRNEGPLEINKTLAELEELQVQMKLTKKMMQRNLKLSNDGVVSETALDQSQEDVEVLKAKIKSAKESLKLKKTQVIHNIRLTEANVAKAQANLMEQETQLSYATLTAPSEGIIASISTQKGETVAASLNSPTFVNLINLRKMEVTVYVDETDIGRVKVGQSAEFTVDSYPKKIFKGRVREIHPKAIIKDNVVNYEAILKIRKEGIALLRPEMTANVVVTTDKKKNALTVHKKAIKRKNKQTFVTIKTGSDVMEKLVKTGWRDGDYIEILSGLSEGEQSGIPIRPAKDKRKRRRPS